MVCARIIQLARALVYDSNVAGAETPPQKWGGGGGGGGGGAGGTYH